MRKKDFVTLEKRLLPKFPDFVVKGSLMFLSPVRHTLRGFHFDPSGVDKAIFYLNVFYLPLCVPNQYLSFTFGHRIRNTGWHSDAPNLEAEMIDEMQAELRFISNLQTIDDVILAIKALVRKSNNIHQYEAIAYMLARAGRNREAMGALDHLFDLLDTSVSWQRDMLERGKSLKAKLLTNPLEAQGQLRSWEADSVRNLGLERFYEPL